MTSTSGCIILVLLTVHLAHSFGLFSRTPTVPKEEVHKPKPKQGSLKLCPPGGPSFFEAFSIICPMRRRRRSIMQPAGGGALEQTMNQCCDWGCEFSDIYRVCNPFG